VQTPRPAGIIYWDDHTRDQASQVLDRAHQLTPGVQLVVCIVEKEVRQLLNEL
jgi:hypothetical protein